MSLTVKITHFHSYQDYKDYKDYKENFAANHCNNLQELTGQLIYDTKCKYWQVVLKLGVFKYINT